MTNFYYTFDFPPFILQKKNVLLITSKLTFKLFLFLDLNHMNTRD